MRYNIADRRIILTGLLFLLFVFVSTYSAGDVFAETLRSEEISLQDDTIMSLLPDSDDLFSGYVNEVFDIQESEDQYEACAAIAPTYRIALDSKQETMYTVLKKKIQKVASGELASTEFDLKNTVSSIYSIAYTENDLGIGSFTAYTAEGKRVITDKAINALKQKIRGLFSALVVDCPYEFYWCDKTYGCSYTPYCEIKGNNCYLYISHIQFYVSADYSQSGTTETFAVDTKKTGSASNAAANAASVVSAHASESDYDKLKSYKKVICDAVSYNKDVNENTNYGDPWQLIYVFDGNSSTNVVCEGYSKAFQYLCSKSSWSDDTFRCISVTGMLIGSSGSGGGHMWNVVTLDYANYMVDITNSDEGAVASSSGRLFMTAADTGNGTSGNPYSFKVQSDQTLYYYYDSDTTDIYDYNTELVLCTSDYGTHTHIWDAGTVTTSPTCTSTGIKTYKCTRTGCNAKKTKVITALGHNVTTHAAKAATCTAAGNSAYYSCSRCNKYFSDKGCTKQIAANSWVISAAGHSVTVYAATAPTCTASGNSTYYSCSRCGKYFSDAGCTKEIAANSWVVAATGHTWDAGVVTTAPTATAAGVKTYTCTVCGLTKTEGVSADTTANNVIRLINAIGTVSTSDACKTKIISARSAYNALSDAQKALVTNYGKLTAAEKTYASMVKEASKESITISMKPSSVKTKVKKNKVTVSWKKIKKTKKTKSILKKIKNVQVQYSTDSKFKKNVKTRKLGKSKTKVTLTLKKNTRYYIRVRYIGSGGVSKWSSVKKVKTKK